MAEIDCVIVAENLDRLVAVPVVEAREQLAYAERMAAKADYHRRLAEQFQHLADISSRKVTLVS